MQTLSTLLSDIVCKQTLAASNESLSRADV